MWKGPVCRRNAGRYDHSCYHVLRAANRDACPREISPSAVGGRDSSATQDVANRQGVTHLDCKHCLALQHVIIASSTVDTA